MRRGLPSLNAVKTFAVVGRHRTFALAAAELGVTSGAVAKQIDQLEQELNTVLVLRNRGTLSLTVPGEDYHRSIAAALDSISQATQRIVVDTRAMHVTINVVPTLGMRWLVPRLNRFKQCNPDVVVEIVSGDGPPDRGMTWDLAIRYGARVWPGFKSDRLFGEAMGVVCAPSLMRGKSFPVRLAQLPKQTLLKHSTRPDIWDRLYAQEQLERPSMREGGSFEHLFLLLEAARLGHGYALVPLFLVESECQAGTLVQAAVETLVPEDAYYLLRREGSLASPVRQSRSWILQEAASMQTEGGAWHATASPVSMQTPLQPGRQARRSFHRIG